MIMYEQQSNNSNVDNKTNNVMTIIYYRVYVQNVYNKTYLLRYDIVLHE